MEEKRENTVPEEGTDSVLPEEDSSGSKVSFILPLLVSIFFFVGFSQDASGSKTQTNDITESSPELKKTPHINFSALLAAEEFSKNLRDTVYTNENLWLELRIDQQMLHIHYRDGHTKNYPVSTGNKYLSKGIESRPGLFAIFLKEEVHLSSQFDNARMNWYMPYNMGIGFHGLPATGYYGNLGVRPSSHGCIRMRNEDVKVLFNECKIGILVLAHRGYSTRVVAFAPEGFKNDGEYTKEDYMNMLAYNLSSLLEGKYFINPPKRFIIEGTVIPKSGINVSSIENIPSRQILPFTIAKNETYPDYLSDRYSENKNAKDLSEPVYAGIFEFSNADSTSAETVELGVSPEMVKKYVYNPIGVLPYFPPGR